MLFGSLKKLGKLGTIEQNPPKGILDIYNKENRAYTDNRALPKKSTESYKTLRIPSMPHNQEDKLSKTRQNKALGQCRGGQFIGNSIKV
jgi:hypothetical protein